MYRNQKQTGRRTTKTKTMKKTIYTESFINLYEAKNAKRVFDSIFGFWQERDFSGAWRRGGFTQYSDIAEDIFRIVMKYGEGFVVDICDKALNKAWELSDKQRWCVAFAFLKISESQIEEYAAEVEAMMAEAEEAEARENAESKEAEVEVESKTESVESVAAEVVTEASKALDAVSKKSRKSQPKLMKSMKTTTLKASYKMRKAIERVEKKYGEMKKSFFVEIYESVRVGRGFYDGCELHCSILQKTVIVNHFGEISW